MYLLLGQALKLAIPPFQYQRARYEKELKEVLRYIFVLNNAAITLMVNNNNNFLMIYTLVLSNRHLILQAISYHKCHFSCV